MAMGIATVVISTLGTVELKTVSILLGIGMFCLGFAGLDSFNEKKIEKKFIVISILTAHEK